MNKINRTMARTPTRVGALALAMSSLGGACILVADDDDTYGEEGDGYYDDGYEGGNGGSGPYGTPPISSSGGSDDDSEGPSRTESEGGSETGDTGDSGDDDTSTDSTESSSSSSDTGDPIGSCGWGPTGQGTVMFGYVCGGEGEDPDGQFGIACPEGVVEGGECGELSGVGCCDGAGNVWFCAAPDDPETPIVFVEVCDA